MMAKPTTLRVLLAMSLVAAAVAQGAQNATTPPATNNTGATPPASNNSGTAPPATNQTGSPPVAAVVVNSPTAAKTPKSTNATTPSPPYKVVTKSSIGMYDCQLSANVDFRDELKRELSGNAKLVDIHITMSGFSEDELVNQGVMNTMYRPTHWVRASSSSGRSLLMLPQSYGYMSMNTLSIGVSSLMANLTAHPEGCLNGLSEEQLLLVLRRSFLNDFKVVTPGGGSGSLSADEHICNMHLVDDGGYAVFQYTCCSMASDGELFCEDVIRNRPLHVLLGLVIVIKFLVMLYSPMIIPESMYRLKYVACQYIYHMPPETKPAGIKVVVTQDPRQFGPENKHKRVRLSQLKNMEVFKALVSSVRWIPEKVYEVKVKDVRLSVRTRRLLGKKTMPVTIIKLIYNNLLRCRIRKLAPLNPCCETNILGNLNPGLNMIKWSQLMKIFASFIFMMILFIPWILRVYAYLTHDEEIYTQMENAAERAGLSMYYSGSLVIYFSPLHAIFVLIYVIFIIDSVVYGTISKPMQEKLKFVMRQCLRDMRERSRLAVLSWMTQLIIWPFKQCGLFGLLIFPVYLALLLLVTLPIVAFYIFPTLNLSIRLIIHLFIFLCPDSVTKRFERLNERFSGVRDRLKMNEVTANETFIKRSDYTTKGIAFQLVVIIMCLISFWSLTLLIMEVCSFFVELFVFTFMGIIVNAATCMKFVTVFFLLYLYGKQIFSSVSKDYLAYHKIIHDELVKMKRGEINEVAKKEEMDQDNTAFRVAGDMATNKPEHPEPIIRVKEHQPMWSTAGMLVFLDKRDNALTPERFFYETIDLNYGGCPGPIYRQVTDAVLEFSRVILFLIFVFIVVMAFGDAYQVSTTNQLMATVAGGFVPFLFRYIFKADTGGPGVDTSSIQFLTEFHKVINAYRQSWAIYDIVPAAVKEWDEDAEKEDDKADNEEGEKESAVDDNANREGDNTNQADPNSSEAPLLNTTDVPLEDPHDEDTLERAASHIVLVEDTDEVDIIVDISTPKTRSANALLKQGFERGSVTMLETGYGKAGASARIYKPSGGKPEHV